MGTTVIFQQVIDVFRLDEGRVVFFVRHVGVTNYVYAVGILNDFMSKYSWKVSVEL